MCYEKNLFWKHIMHVPDFVVAHMYSINFSFFCLFFFPQKVSHREKKNSDLLQDFYFEVNFSEIGSTSPNSNGRSLGSLFQGVVQTLFMDSGWWRAGCWRLCRQKDFFLDDTSRVFASVLLWSDHYPNQQRCFAYLYNNNGFQTDIWGNLMFSLTFSVTFLPEISPFISSVYSVTLIPQFCLTGQARLTHFTAFTWGCGVWRFSRWRGCLTDRRSWFHFLAGDFLSGVICSSCVCADVASGYFCFLTWRARWNISRISWIYFRCPSGKELIDVWE